MPTTRLLAPLRCAAALLAVAFACSCGAADDSSSSSADACAAAAAHFEECFGPEASSLYAAEGCNEASAARVVELGCDGLANSVVDGKADGIVDAAVQEAIWEAIRQAIEVAMDQVIAAVMQQLGADLDAYAFYVVFDEADDAAGAEQLALELGAALSDLPSMAPLAYEQAGAHYVLHGPCPVDLQSGLAELIADVIVTHREVVQILGGKVTEEPNEDGTTSIGITLSFGLLPGDPSLPATLGCGR